MSATDELLDDDLFEGLESNDEPQDDFDVSKNLRAIVKLQYKLKKQKDYKTRVENQLKQGIKNTESSIDFLKDQVVKYMRRTSKSKLKFDDVGSVTLNLELVKDFNVDDEAQVIEFLEKNPEHLAALKVEKSVRATELKSLLEAGVKVPGVTEVQKQATPRFTLK